MYTEYFGLREPPFTLTPNTRFFLSFPSHQEALNLLLIALGSGDGFVKVVGEVGTGKTLLCRKLLNSLDDEAFVTVYLPNAYLSPDEFRYSVASELGINALGKSNHDLLQMINQSLISYAQQNQRVVLLVDEAQAMPEETIEALRLLTNLETESQKLFQVVLFGQPELDALLQRHSLRQLQQRITASCRLKPLSAAEVEGYLRSRLESAGYKGLPLFQRSAARQIALASGGIPRLVNILAHKALLAAYGKGDERITDRHVRAAISDTEGVKRHALAIWPVILSAVLASALAWSLAVGGWAL
jgi:MSHA biogenesis protein MshM